MHHLLLVHTIKRGHSSAQMLANGRRSGNDGVDRTITLVQRLDQMQLESPQEPIDFEAVFRDPTRDELAELKARQTMRSLQWLRTASMCMRLSQGRTMEELVRIYGAPIIEKRLRMAHADPRRAKEGLPPPALARAVAARIAIDDGLAQALL